MTNYRQRAWLPAILWLINLSSSFSAAVAAESPEHSERQWSDDTGRFNVKATFIRLTESEVTLQKSDKSVVTVPLARLSADDKSYVKAIATEATASREFG